MKDLLQCVTLWHWPTRPFAALQNSSQISDCGSTTQINHYRCRLTFAKLKPGFWEYLARIIGIVASTCAKSILSYLSARFRIGRLWLCRPLLFLLLAELKGANLKVRGSFSSYRVLLSAAPVECNTPKVIALPAGADFLQFGSGGM
jgi:hypothetical protein